MDITNDTIDKLQSYGLNLSPAVYGGADDKAPGLNRKQKWRYDWTKEELLKSKRVGIFHEPSSTYDIDFDDKNFVAHQFHSLLPDTFSIGKKYKGSAILTHKIYAKPKDVKIDKWSYPKSVLNGSGKIIERLNKFTVIADQDRTIIKDVKPTVADPADILIRCKMIAFFTELKKHWPEEGSRDEAYLRLTGALASQTDVPVNVQEEFIEQLCIITGDREVKNRVNKVQYQHDQVAKGKNVYGIKELATSLNVNLPAFDILKHEDEKSEKKVYKIQYSNLIDFMSTHFPEPVYMIDPLVREQSITAIVGEPGVGKTLLGLRLAAGVACGCGFMSMPSIDGSRPVYYMEGELPAGDVKSRLNDIRSDFSKKGIKFNDDYFNIATLQQQKDFGFPPLHEEVGRDAVEEVIEEISERTGKKVYIHLDNISSLCPGFEENKAESWSPMMNWMIKLKNKGHTVCYYHHLNHAKYASGSTMQTRGIQMTMRLIKPDTKHKIPMKGEKAMQAIVDFPKWTLHDNSKAAQPHILTCDEEQNWKKYPLLEIDELKIIKFHEDGLTVKEMVEELDLKESTIYRKLKRLKDMELIKDDKPN